MYACNLHNLFSKHVLNAIYFKLREEKNNFFNFILTSNCEVFNYLVLDASLKHDLLNQHNHDGTFMKIIMKNVLRMVCKRSRLSPIEPLSRFTIVHFNKTEFPHLLTNSRISEHKRIKHSRFAIQVSFLGCENFRQIQWKFTSPALYFLFPRFCPFNWTFNHINGESFQIFFMMITTMQFNDEDEKKNNVRKRKFCGSSTSKLFN